MRVFKKILKAGDILLGTIVIVSGLFLAHTWYFKPVSINLFFGRTMLQIMLESPELLSMLHVLEPFGIKGHNAKLDDESLAAGDHFFGQLKDAHRVLLSYQDDDLNEAWLDACEEAGVGTENEHEATAQQWLAIRNAVLEKIPSLSF